MKNKKKIIFIGGTSRSGSTLLDLILGNNEKSLSLGEIKSIFHPTKRKHLELIHQLKKDKVWSKIIKDGKKKLYDNIIKNYPDKEIFIDSSKDPLWINYFNKSLNEKYDVKNVLIYKKPEELAKSYTKRGYGDTWKDVYINYHKKYNTLIKNYSTIYLGDLLESEETLQKICDKLGIPYHRNMRNYYKQNYPLFYGSETPNKKERIRSENNFNTIIDISVDNRKRFDEVEAILKKRDIHSKGDEVTHNNFRYSVSEILMFKIKRILQSIYFRLKSLMFNYSAFN
jgi:hypothetical protein